MVEIFPPKHDKNKTFTLEISKQFLHYRVHLQLLLRFEVEDCLSLPYDHSQRKFSELLHISRSIVNKALQIYVKWEQYDSLAETTGTS
ncbi:unnamed protein product [Rhizophagus irregularis]|nr:unnamed protein product [Rhizophagus irregularis]